MGSRVRLAASMAAALGGEQRYFGLTTGDEGTVMRVDSELQPTTTAAAAFALSSRCLMVAWDREGGRVHSLVPEKLLWPVRGGGLVARGTGAVRREDALREGHAPRREPSLIQHPPPCALPSGCLPLLHCANRPNLYWGCRPAAPTCRCR